LLFGPLVIIGSVVPPFQFKMSFLRPFIIASIYQAMSLGHIQTEVLQGSRHQLYWPFTSRSGREMVPRLTLWICSIIGSIKAGLFHYTNRNLDITCIGLESFETPTLIMNKDSCVVFGRHSLIMTRSQQNYRPPLRCLKVFTSIRHQHSLQPPTRRTPMTLAQQ
jgi:hypothetical protein